MAIETEDRTGMATADREETQEISGIGPGLRFEVIRDYGDSWRMDASDPDGRRHSATFIGPGARIEALLCAQYLNGLAGTSIATGPGP